MDPPSPFLSLSAPSLFQTFFSSLGYKDLSPRPLQVNRLPSFKPTGIGSNPCRTMASCYVLDLVSDFKTFKPKALFYCERTCTCRAAVRGARCVCTASFKRWKTYNRAHSPGVMISLVSSQERLLFFSLTQEYFELMNESMFYT